MWQAAAVVINHCKIKENRHFSEFNNIIGLLYRTMSRSIKTNIKAIKYQNVSKYIDNTAMI